MTLYQECLDALKDYCLVDKMNTQNVLSKIKLTSYGRIEKKYYHKHQVIQIDSIPKYGSKDCYIVYSDAEIPIIKTRFDAVINSLDDVLAVSFDTWIIIEIDDYYDIIEFFHDGKITLLSSKT